MVPSGLETGTGGLTQQSSSVAEGLNFDQVIIFGQNKKHCVDLSRKEYFLETQ